MLAAVTVAVLALLEVRGHYMPSLARGYLVWNLFLAWIPYVCARMIWRAGRGSTPLPLLLPLLAIWFVFLPNAPYLVTDVVHFHWNATGLELVVETALFATVGVAGLLLGVASVQPIHRIVAVRYGSLAARTFPPVIAVAVAFGVYLGRVQRWNSWSFIESPGRLFQGTWDVLGHPMAHPRAYGGIALFSFAFLVVYSVLTAERAVLGRPQRQP
ncbi:MAG: hypothetical protein QOH15_609 [Gaiellales bacterium]|jgi:uncharacterized membrane protein|nr:hypothetical protein [Gaiellales bacterium]